MLLEEVFEKIILKVSRHHQKCDKNTQNAKFKIITMTFWYFNMRITMIIYFLSAPTAYDCTFEQGFCQWTQSMTDNFNWTRAQGPTGSSLTGPTNDHTTGKGTYHQKFAADEVFKPRVQCTLFKDLTLTPKNVNKRICSR